MINTTSPELPFQLDLDLYRDPIVDALSTYQFFSTADPSCRVEFDVDAAAELAPTPDRPYAARSVSVVKHLGQAVGDLTVIAFEPFDGTGNTDTYALSELEPGDYDMWSGVVPRSKQAVAEEVHIPLLAHREGSDSVRVLAGRLDVLGLDGRQVVKIASVGQTALDFSRVMEGGEVAGRAVTYTTGKWRSPGAQKAERQGDPHAIHNPYDDVVQVCAFLALGFDTPERHRDVLKKLGAQIPSPRE